MRPADRVLSGIGILAVLTALTIIWVARLTIPRDLYQAAKLDGATAAGSKMVRASLLKGDFLMRSLGRPNRDQIVSVRPEVLTTLEAIDLSNGETLALILTQGSQKLQSKGWKSPAEFSDWLYHFALSRPPSEGEQQVMAELLGEKLLSASAGSEGDYLSTCLVPEGQAQGRAEGCQAVLFP